MDRTIIPTVVVLVVAIVPWSPAKSQNARAPSPVLIGTAIGGGSGVVAGLLFANEACDADPCSGGAQLVAAVAGGALLGAMGALIGAQARAPEAARRNAFTGAAIGAGLGVAGGVLLVATTCDDCGFTGYTSLAMVGAGVMGGLGALIGSRVGRSDQAFRVGSTTASALIGAAGRNVLMGVRIEYCTRTRPHAGRRPQGW